MSKAGRDAFQFIDGLFCATDLMALGAMDALRLDLGLAIPDEIQVVGFDDIEPAEWGSYALSTIRQNLEEQAMLALQLLKDRMANSTSKTRIVRVELLSIHRETTKHAH